MSIGHTMSCHRVSGDKITPENFADFHNTPSKLHDRKRMLEGKWPDTDGPNPLKPHWGCEVCREIEEAGGMSDRLIANSSFHKFQDRVPKETKDNAQAIITTPTTLEIFYNNQCNQACIYCGSKFSSLIAAEEIKFKGPEFNTAKEVSNYRKDYPDLLSAHFKWMKENAQSLIKYNILGGEPFFQSELEQNIDFFMENKCPDLLVKVFSNLNIEPDTFRKKLDRIKYLVVNKHIGHFTLLCSFDCWGPQIEYIRYGTNLKRWEENFLIILTEYPEIDPIIHSTITALTFPKLPDLIERIKYWNLFRPVKQTISTVDSKPYLHPGILPKEYYQEFIMRSVEIYKDIIRIIQNMDYKNDHYKRRKKHLLQSYDQLIIQLKGFEKTFTAHKVDLDLINELKTFLNKNYFKRGCNWKELWPWLDDIN